MQHGGQAVECVTSAGSRDGQGPEPLGWTVQGGCLDCPKSRLDDPPQLPWAVSGWRTAARDSSRQHREARSLISPGIRP